MKLISTVSALALVFASACASAPEEAGADEATGEEANALSIAYCEIDAAHATFTGRCNKTGMMPAQCFLPPSASCPAGQPATFKGTGMCGSVAPLTTLQLSTTRCF